MLMNGLCADSASMKDNCVFSFYMTDHSGSSYIDFGAINTAIVTDTSKLVTMDIIEEEFWWAQWVTGFRWGNEWTDDQTEYKINKEYGMTDTGSSCIIGPPRTIDYITRTILSTSDSVKNGPDIEFSSKKTKTFNCSDKSKMPSFDLLFGDYWFKVNPEDYLYHIPGKKGCTLCLEKSTDGDYWILGDVFMRGYYNIHDHTNKQIGFYSIDESKKPVPSKVVRRPTETIPYYILGLKRTKFIILATCVAVIITAATTFAIVFFCFYALLKRAAKMQNKV